MHWKLLLEGTKKNKKYEPAYAKALKDLCWGPADFDMHKNMQVVEEFLRAWMSWRRGLDMDRLKNRWGKEI